MAEAVACPPVAKALGLYASATFRHEWTGPASTLEWLRRDPDPALGGVAASIPARLRNVLTIQDVFLNNRSLWLLGRNADGTIYDAAWLPPTDWSVDDNTGAILVQNKPQPVGSYIYFQGAKLLPFLESAKASLNHYADMARTISSRGRNPMPIVELALQEDYEFPVPGDTDYVKEEDPLLEVAKNWGLARRSEEGAVAVTPRNVKAIFHQPTDDGAMLIEARNAVRLDVANHGNLNAELLDGDNGSSDTYSNSLQNRGDFADLSLPLFLDPITARLSMPDVSPDGAVNLVWPPSAPAPDASGNTGHAVAPALEESSRPAPPATAA